MEIESADESQRHQDRHSFLPQRKEDQQLGRNIFARIGCVAVCIAAILALMRQNLAKSASQIAEEDLVELVTIEQRPFCRVLEIGSITYKQWLRQSLEGEKLQRGEEVVEVDTDFLAKSIMTATRSHHMVLHQAGDLNCGFTGNVCWIADDARLGLFLINVTEKTPPTIIGHGGHLADKYWCVTKWLTLEDFSAMALERLGGLDEQPACLVTALYQKHLPAPEDIVDEAWKSSRVILHHDPLFRAVRAISVLHWKRRLLTCLQTPQGNQSTNATRASAVVEAAKAAAQAAANAEKAAAAAKEAAAAAKAAAAAALSAGAPGRAAGTATQAEQLENCARFESVGDAHEIGSNCCQSAAGFICCAAAASASTNSSNSTGCPQGMDRLNF